METFISFILASIVIMGITLFYLASIYLLVVGVSSLVNQFNIHTK